MPWSASYSADADAVMTTYAGVIPPDLLAEAVKGTMALGLEKGTSRFLADCTALEGGHSIVDLYFISQLLEDAGISRSFREAIVLPQLQSAAAEVRFWENHLLEPRHGRAGVQDHARGPGLARRTPVGILLSG